MIQITACTIVHHWGTVSARIRPRTSRVHPQLEGRRGGPVRSGFSEQP